MIEAPEDSSPSEDSSPGKTARTASIVRTTLGYLWAVAAVAVLVFPISLSLSPARLDDVTGTAFMAAGLALFAVFLGTGALVILRRPRAGTVSVVVATMALILSAFGAAQGLALLGVVLALLVLPTYAVLWPPVWRTFRAPRDATDRPHVQRSLRYALLIVTGLGLVYALESNVDSAAEWVEFRRAKSECEETQNVEACGTYAFLMLRRADSIDEAQEGMQRITRICREHERPFACRISALGRSESWRGALRGAYITIARHEFHESTRHCLKGNAKACFVRAFAVAAPAEDLLARAAEDLCEKGEALACRAASEMLSAGPGLPSQEPRLLQALQRSCEAGFVLDCRRLGRAQPGPPADACLGGEFGACARAAGETNNPLHREAFLALGTVRGPANLGLYGVALSEPSEWRIACDDGDGIACMAGGLHGGRGDLERWRSPEPDVDELADTFGRACDLGVDLGCIAFAERLLNRPLDETRDIEKANRLLAVACSRGSARACWLRNFEREILLGELKGLEKAAAAACRAMRDGSSPHDPCSEYAHLLSYDLGFRPWGSSERVGLAHMHSTCARYSDPFTCARMAYMLNLSRREILDTAFATRHAAGWDAAARSCSQGKTIGCNELLSASLSPHFPPPSSFREIEADICEKQPQICDELYK